MSPVHDQSYRRYQGQRRPLGQAWAVILRAGLREFLSRRAFLGLLLLAWGPFLVRTVQIYAVVTYPQARDVMGVTPQLFRDFVDFQGWFAFFVTIYVGAGLIANDRRANALPVYLSKPLMRIEYIAGKLGVLLVYLAAVTILPAVMLLAVQLALAGNFELHRAHPFLVPAVLLSSALRVVVPALAMLALSSLSTSSRYVAVLYTGLLFVSETIYGVMTFVTGSTRVAWISFSRNVDVVTDAIFRLPPRYQTPVVVSALVLLCVVVLSISVLERRVRGVEVVS
jgi:ABC-type transport system involved in multi-copper enzyme maturation permease subunit